MRFRSAALLVALLFFSPQTLGSICGSGQSNQVDDARNGLAQAFLYVQNADLGGASPSQISKLSIGLNLALLYEENATHLLQQKNSTGSFFYENLSVTMSTMTSQQALSVASAARTQTAYGQAIAYSLAIMAAFGSTLVILESHRASNFLRRILLRRVRLG